jgi:hypothetical protein
VELFKPHSLGFLGFFRVDCCNNRSLFFRRLLKHRINFPLNCYRFKRFKKTLVAIVFVLAFDKIFGLVYHHFVQLVFFGFLVLVPKRMAVVPQYLYNPRLALRLLRLPPVVDLGACHLVDPLVELFDTEVMRFRSAEPV